MKFKKLWLYILTPLLVLLGSAVLTNTVQAKELQNVITNVQVWDVDNGKLKEPDANGVYDLTINKAYSNYKYMVDFDLSKYNGQLSDGDTFTFTIPAPLTVKNETFEITDKSTGVAVASAQVVSNGENSGGKVTITLQKLNEYLAKKGGTQVNDVSGTFYTGFSVKKDITQQNITYPDTETKNKVTHIIKSRQPSRPNYGDEIGHTNFAKVHGVITKGSWSSQILNKSGEYYHPFTLRVNDRQESYNVLDIHDYISDNYSPTQFIPETLHVVSGYYDSDYNLQDKKELKEGVDYTIEWNESYTDFKIKINNASSHVASNGKPASFQITYQTTAPADGTKIGNNMEVSGDNVPLTYRTDRTDTKVSVWRNSQVTNGGTIQLKTGYRITLYKVDEKTQNRLAGAKFKITPPSGATATEETVTTNADGVAQSSVYSEDDVKKGNFTVTEVEAPKGYELDSTPFEVTVGKDGVIKTVKNKRTSAKAQLSAIKKLTGRAMKAGEFEFDLFDDKTNKVVETVTNDQDGNIKFAELSFDQEGEYTYHIVEKKANTTEKGVTYDANPVEVKVTVTTDATTGKLVAAVTYENDDKTFENTYAAEKTSASLEVTKKLTGRELKADEFEFVLKNDADGSELQKVKNTADGKVTFAPIEYTKAGTYNYTIVETNAGQTIDGVTYDNLEVKVTVEVTDDGEGKLHANVTYPADKEFNNSYGTSKAKASLEVTKKLTGRELKADEFEFTLTDQDGNVKETVKNDKDGNVKFSELEFDKAGTYTYKIAEKAGTATGIQYDTKTITATVTVADNGKGVLEATVAYDDEKAFENTYTPAGATSVTLGAKKVLEGKDLEAGKYSFELKKEDGSVVETVTNAADGTVTFSPISYDESQVGTHKYTISEVAGSEAGITYDKTVQEVEVTVEKVSATELKATASKEAKDLVFTNKYTPAKTQVSVKKTWDDKDNQDGKRPSSVTVKLLADGQDTGKTLELNAANGLAGSFADLDADKGGTPIKYTVVEVTVPGYTSEVTGDAASGFTITNSYSPETVDIKATKNWDDANNQDGKRPTKITINLLADGQKVASKEVQAAADGTWTATFEKLAKYKAGKEIKYTVTEEAVAEYESTITDFTITNKYAPKEIDYKVTKVWNDANDQDGKRPKSVTVQLFKSVDGSKPVAVESKKLTLTAKDKTDANTWVASFTKLPQYEAGKEITYSIKEVDVPAGYEASVTGQVVTNTHNPETVVLSGTKVWDDNNNQDGKRTKSVKVQILNGDKVVQEIEVSEKTGWKFESKALPKYENGTEIKYTVKEVAVKEYTSTVTTDKDGKYTVTNTHAPEKTSVKGHKIWKDEENKDGIRPASITVKLLADGKDTGKTAVASEATGWTYEFTDLDRYKDGQAIEYSVVEVPVDGYTSEVEGFNITNTHTPEKPTPGKPNEPGKPGPKPQLPNTGEKASSAAVVAGLALMAVTGGLYFVSRKNK
ncbi:adhesin [Streptococcus oralis subsp. tigurinus]|uniref:Adhesin n=1 Tax=Streptococcus oralis subsp. tigurinus TaxID=1077464 RepID=A0A1X0X323_STROR|nr:Cna B-type domain-containing protein [Streptococcus oralis]ORJ33408.1 adhesin [Streptococcus oralis subsp. tigurinus]